MLTNTHYKTRWWHLVGTVVIALCGVGILLAVMQQSRPVEASKSIPHPPSLAMQTNMSTSVIITGPTTGAVNTQYVFTATVRPITTAMPITYVWQATGQLPVTHSDGLSDSANFTWLVGGPNVLTVTARNITGVVSCTHSIMITAWPQVIPPAAVTISGPVTGSAFTAQVFTAMIKPITAALPITYIWKVEGQPAVIHTGNLSDTFSYYMRTPGIQAITVTAMNEAGNVVGHYATFLPANEMFGSGRDGDFVVTSTMDLNPVRASASGTAGSNLLNLTSVIGSGFQTDTLILIHQTRGPNAGQWEFGQIQSVGTSQLTLTLKAPLFNTYVTDAGASRAQVLWVPQYRDFTVNEGVILSPDPWDENTGGILAVLASGNVVISGTLLVAGNDGASGNTGNPAGGYGIGFEGGLADVVNNDNMGRGNAGEGTGGPSVVQSVPNGSGGGASDEDGGNGADGAGGGNGTQGENGTVSQSGSYGQGGLAVSNEILTVMNLGGGGAGGSGERTVHNCGGGGAGGGIVLIFGKNIVIGTTGSINANGGNGGGSDRGAGGGAGGSVLFKGLTVSIDTNLINAAGGSGGLGAGGGNGGDGRIRIEYCDVFSGTTSNPAASAQKLNCMMPAVYEPNNTCTASQPITPNISLASYLTATDDLDLYRVGLWKPYTVISITLVSPLDAEFTLDLFDSPCEGGLPRPWGLPRDWDLPRPWGLPRVWELPRPWGLGPGSSKAIVYNIGPFTGTYYIEVRGVDGQTSVLPYILNIFMRQGESPLPEEPVDSCSSSTLITPPAVITSPINSPTETHHYRFDVLQPNSQIAITLTSVSTYSLDLFDTCDNGQPHHEETPLDWNISPTATVKSLIYNTGPYTGTYFVRVYSQDNTYTATNVYTLALDTRIISDTTIKTLIVYNRERLQSLYGQTETDALVAKLADLAANPAVSGHLLAVDDDPQVRRKYVEWLSNPTKTRKANEVSTAIKTYMLAELSNYPDLKYIVIVGNDWVVPFRRVADWSRFRESRYVNLSEGLPQTPIGAGMREDYFLSDDFYGDRSNTVWNKYTVYVPDFGVGRLVETPAEIMAFIDIFLKGNSTVAETSLVTGYDVMIDSSRAISEQIRNSSYMSQTALIGNNWRGADVITALLQTPIDLAALNMHGDHWGLGAPLDWGMNSSDVVSATAVMSQAVYISPACHAGLNIPDQYGDSPDLPSLDLPQAFLRRGANWIGNTGYGIGGDGIVYSEEMIVLLNEELTDGSGQTVGEALVKTKQRYYANKPGKDFRFSDRKSLSELTLYGLPMYTLRTNPASQRTAATPDGGMVHPTWRSGTCTSAQVFTYTPHLSAVTSTAGITGTYYQTQDELNGSMPMNGGVHALEDYPIQPRWVTTVSANVHGVVFEGGHYTTLRPFDPVIARLSTSDEPTGKEQTFDGPQWWPSQLAVLNRLKTLWRYKQSLILLPGQYRGDDAQERLYDQIKVSFYTSSSKDWQAPTIHNIMHTIGAGAAIITATVTEGTDTCRVVVAYTDGKGVWNTVDLTDVGNGTWRGALTAFGSLEYFIQAVDQAGNVAVNDNNGSYYTVSIPNAIYLPLILNV